MYPLRLELVENGFLVSLTENGKRASRWNFANGG